MGEKGIQVGSITTVGEGTSVILTSKQKISSDYIFASGKGSSVKLDNSQGEGGIQTGYISAVGANASITLDSKGNGDIQTGYISAGGANASITLDSKGNGDIQTGYIFAGGANASITLDSKGNGDIQTGYIFASGANASITLDSKGNGDIRTGYISAVGANALIALMSKKNINSEHIEVTGLSASVVLKTQENITITDSLSTVAKNSPYRLGILNYGNTVTLETAKDNIITFTNNSPVNMQVFGGIFASDYSGTEGGIVTLSATNNRISVEGASTDEKYLIVAKSSNPTSMNRVELIATQDNLLKMDNRASKLLYGVFANKGDVRLVAKGINSLIISRDEQATESDSGVIPTVYGYRTSGVQGTIEVEGKVNNFLLDTPNVRTRYGVSSSAGTINITATAGDNQFTISSDTQFDTSQSGGGNIYGILSTAGGKSTFKASRFNQLIIGKEEGIAKDTMKSSVYGLSSDGRGTIELEAAENHLSVNANAWNGIVVKTFDADFTSGGIQLTATEAGNFITHQTSVNSTPTQGTEGNLIKAQGSNVTLSAPNGINHLSATLLLNQALPEDLRNIKSLYRGITAWRGNEVKLSAKANTIQLYSEGSGLGLGYQSTDGVLRNTHTLQSIGVLATGVDKAGKGIAGATAQLIASAGDNTVDMQLRVHGEVYGVVSQHESKVLLSAEQGRNLITVINPDINTPQMPLLDSKLVYRIGLHNSGNSTLKLNAKENRISIGGNPTIQTGIFTGSESSTELLASTGDNHVIVKNAMLGSRGLEVKPDIITSTSNQQSLTLNAPNGNNIIELSGDSQDLAIINASPVLKQREDYLRGEGTTGAFASDKGSMLTLRAKNNIIQQTLPENTEHLKHYGASARDESRIVLEAQERNQLTGANIGVSANTKAHIELVAPHNTVLASKTAVRSSYEGVASIEGELNIAAPVAAVAFSAGQVQLNYSQSSRIQGHMWADNGQIEVKSHGSTLLMKGDSQAINGGLVALNLTPNSYLEGRIDNFNAFANAQHNALFPMIQDSLNPAAIANSAGTVNLNLAKDSLWMMTGQSWVSQLGGEGTVDLNSQTEGRALHIDKLAGANRFLMQLNKDGVHSDMLYVKEGTATPQDVVIKNLPEVVNSMDYGDRLRFATVQRSQNEFVNGKVYATTEDRLFRQALRVEYSDQATDPDNTVEYNQAFNGQEMTQEKAGDVYSQEYGGAGSQNVYLVKSRDNHPSRNTTDIGDMFDATAYYGFMLDTYTKREGERAYSLLDKKEGAWARATHTRLTQSGVFSFNNNDYEIGYDKFSRNEEEKKRKWGLSFTYSHAKASLDNEFSKGRIKKYVLSLYNTNQRQNEEGDDSYYNDNVLRIGALHNHYDAVMRNGQLWGRGDYKNYLLSASTEHGYRKFIDDDKRWYIVPQAQLQFAYLTSADYRTSNDIEVKLSHTKSLIGRVGMDVVRWLDETGDNRLYVKGNILHEFLGKRSFNAKDRTGAYQNSWNTRGTWYAVGVGYNAHVSEKTNVFIDAEKEFGHGRAGSYNLRLAISWQFK
ncbi:autotransporter outer membrane beta-barrel domain-containing protein [Gallibacterium melopsittaci]|uniref:Autotransporter outer membrane beta-barrel domain-containing protein n=1 Tax=Gallibacterium melopsittaci TaxID=516063 RepID=A0ABV6HZ80_9PAST